MDEPEIPPQLEGMPPGMQQLRPMQQDKGGLFKKSNQDEVGPIYNELNSLSARARIAEERYTNLRKKTQLIEQNMLSNQRSINIEIKTTNSEMNDIKREFQDIKTRIKLIGNELQSFAKRDELKVVERYVNLWEPLKFVTLSQVEDTVRRILEEEKEKQSPK
jgi:hypothetical protein